MRRQTEETPVRSWSQTANHLLVRVYKVFGLVALIAIFVGLVSFVTVNVFYLVDNTWVRPVIFTPEHPLVVRAHGDLATHATEKDSLLARRQSLEAELAGLERRISLSKTFQANYEEMIDLKDPASPEELLLRRQYDQALLQVEEASARKATVQREMELVDRGIERFEGLISQIQSSPFIVALERETSAVFAPYENLHNVRAGVPLYHCRLGIVWCSKVGRIAQLLPGEVDNLHPQDGTSTRGKILEVAFTQPGAARHRILFAGKRPLWLF